MDSTQEEFESRRCLDLRKVAGLLQAADEVIPTAIVMLSRSDLYQMICLSFFRRINAHGTKK